MNIQDTDLIEQEYIKAITKYIKAQPDTSKLLSFWQERTTELYYLGHANAFNMAIGYLEYINEIKITSRSVMFGTDEEGAATITILYWFKQVD